MKIGIIFFGLPRASSITLPTIKQFIFDALVEHTVFIESCLTLQETVQNPRSDESCALNTSNYDFFKTYSNQLLLPSQLLNHELYSAILELGDPWDDGGQSLKNILMQLHSLKLAYLNCKRHACDVYLFVRPDLLIHEQIPIKEFIRQYANQSVLMLPSWQWHKGLNDRFAMASASASDAYALRYDRLLSYCQQNKQALHGESLLAYRLKSERIQIKTCRTKMSRVRASGQIKSENFSSIMGKNSFKNILSAMLGQVRFQDKVWVLYELIEFSIYSVAVKFKVVKKRW